MRWCGVALALFRRDRLASCSQVRIVPGNGLAVVRRRRHRLEQLAGAQLADVHVHAVQIEALHRVDRRMVVRLKGACWGLGGEIRDD